MKSKKRTGPKITERNEQAELFTRLRKLENVHTDLQLVFGYPLGTVFDPSAMSRMRAIGARESVPDIWIPIPRAPHCGMVIELKRNDSEESKRGALRIDQAVYLARLAVLGWKCCVCWGADEAFDAAMEYLGIPITTKFSEMKNV